MTDQELRKLSRADLLEMMVDLNEELNQVKMQLEAAEEKLNSRQIMIDKAGAIAESALQLIASFETGTVVVQSTDTVQQFNERQEELSRKQEEICRKIEWECREKARLRLEEVERKCIQMEADTVERCAKMQALARTGNPNYLEV